MRVLESAYQSFGERTEKLLCGYQWEYTSFLKILFKKKKKKNHISFRVQQVIFWTAHQKSVESKVSSCLLADVEISSCGLCYRKIRYLGERTQPQYGEKALTSPTAWVWLALAFSLLWDKLGMGPQQAARAPLSCKGG